MAIISCPECGKQISDRAASCPDCGCPINTAPVVDAQESIRKEVEKLLILARRARESSDSVNAKKYYNQIQEKDPGNWEGIFFSVYYEASQCKLMNVASAAISVGNCIFSTFSAIGDLPAEEQDDALKTVQAHAMLIAQMFVSAATNHYNQFSTTNNAFGECSNRVVAAGTIYTEMETSFKKVFPEKKKELADLQKALASFLDNSRRWYNDTYLTSSFTRLGEEIKTVYPEYVEPIVTTYTTTSGGGCYVATCVYGSYDCPQVWTLRRYRDNMLAETMLGRLFIRVYYACSPTIVKWFGDTVWFKKLWKGKLDRMVAKLQADGVEATPYNDRKW